MSLSRCPFCGGKASVIGNWGGSGYASAVCSSCEATGGMKESMEAAERAWNSRAIYLDADKTFPVYIDNPENIKLYDDMTSIRIIIHAGVSPYRITDRLVEIDSLKWREDILTDKNHECTEVFRYITLADIAEQIKATGYDSTILVISEDPMNGTIYRYGNSGDFWERVGRMCGYA